MDFLLKLLGAKKRMKIQGGKLWEITRLWGFDLRKIEREPAKPEPFIPPERGKIEGLRMHDIKQHDDDNNLTRNPDLM